MKGLTQSEAESLLKKYGLNQIVEKEKDGIFKVFVEQLNNFLTILLIVAALLSFFIGESIDGGLILSIVVLNAMFGVYQEYKASEAIAALKEMTITKVRVLRDGREIEIDSRYLVPGDIIFIEEGVKMPADGVVLQSINLEMNESALTGESLAVAKSEKDESFMGTIVTRGRGYVEIKNTGMQTKFGEIARQLDQIEEVKSPLQTKLEQVTKTIGIIGIAASLLVFFLATFEGSSYFAAFLLAISLAVAVVPEGLPAVMTITLSIGVKEMARKKAIIRKLTAIEALGSITLIATDKTGTLTTNKMKVKEVYFDDVIHQNLEKASIQNETFQQLVMNGVLCSTATLNPTDDGKQIKVLGDPTEGALLMLAEDKEQIVEKLRDDWQLIEEIPFDSVTKRMTVKVKKGNKKVTYSKGAPESILQISDSILTKGKVHAITPVVKNEIEKVLETWATQGLRILAFSYKEDHGNEKEKQIFLGMTAIYDAPRPEIKEAVERARTAGIEVVMVTGDNEKTAAAIAKDAGLLLKSDRVMTGRELEELSDEELLKIIPHVRIFARTTPLHKHRIVSAFQRLGEIVAVTGDGVNDAIALKQADVGVAMGLVGTDVARETADMVITDDNFATIVDAIEEGRNIIKNLRNAVAYLLSCNISEALSLIIAMFVGMPHIFYPIQFLYINLVTDGIPALALAFSPRDTAVMMRKPEKKLQLMGREDLVYIFSVGLIATVLVLTGFYVSNLYRGHGGVAAFSILALMQSFIFLDVWLSKRNIFGHFEKLLSPVFFVAFFLPFITQGIIIHSARISELFKVETASWSEYMLYILVAGSILFILMIVKPIMKLTKTQ